ncbi:unnamed protein product, partial [Polarella glacialis]
LPEFALRAWVVQPRRDFVKSWPRQAVCKQSLPEAWPTHPLLHSAVLSGQRQQQHIPFCTAPLVKRLGAGESNNHTNNTNNNNTNTNNNIPFCQRLGVSGERFVGGACLAVAPALLVDPGMTDGLWQAVALVGASEVGDKTFFLAATRLNVVVVVVV